VKTWFRRLDDAVGKNDSTTADDEYRSLISRIDRAVKTGALHRNNGARKKARAARIRSRLS
jgi:small subunit ribosomal protein S20